MKPTAEFSCSNDLVNRFVACTLLSAKNNHADVPTDCPDPRTPRLDGRRADLFADTASYFFEYAPFARKYILDMLDGQRRNGKIPSDNPRGGMNRYMNDGRLCGLVGRGRTDTLLQNMEAVRRRIPLYGIITPR